MVVPFAYTRRRRDDLTTSPEQVTASQGYYPTNIIGDDEESGDYVPAAALQATYRDPQADEPPAIDPQVMAAIRAESAVAPPPTEAPAASPGLSPQLASIKEAHDSARAAAGLPPDAPYTGEMATDSNTPTVVQDKNRRPGKVYGPNARANASALRTAVNEYEPQKAKGWWNRYAKPAIMGWAAGQRGSLSPFAGLGGALGGVLGTAVNPTAQDEAWKAQKQAELQGQEEQQLESEKTRLGMEKTRAEIDNLKKPKEKPKRLVKNSKGVFVLVDTETGLGPDGKAVTGTLPADANDWVLTTDETGLRVPINKKTGLDQKGNPVKATSKVQMPDGTWVSADTIFAREGRQGDQAWTLDISNQEASQHNAQVQANIDAANKDKARIWAERDRLEAAGQKFVVETYRDADDKARERKVLNPEWVRLDTQGNALNDDIRRFEASKKPVVKPPPRPTVTGGKSKIPAKTVPAAQLKELGIM